ncbi:succinate-semialdehyde dehydrogenase, mitochondrial isoform X2 [Cimex lectularius]|nr:succinate-semialdehyde dehydrogenase, mitochondrial isoform X2 [Cimex lectularius]
METRHIQNHAYINGNWVKSLSGKTFDVFNPSNGELITNVPDMNVEDVKCAVDAAAESFLTWSLTTAKERGQLLRQWYNILNENSEKLAKLVQLEAGKPFSEALGEVAYGNAFIDWFSEEARRCYGEVLCSPVKNKELMHIKQPIGVAALLTPWNFPHAMITRKAGAALAAGCTCVIKPAEDTPLTALALAEYAEKAGIPKGVINVVTCDRPSVGAVGKFLCETPLVSVITFTGSTVVGKLLFNQCAPSVKRISLELGGNAPFIVFKTADVSKAVLGAVASKFRNCGQACISANRFLIEESVFDQFVNEFTSYVKENISFEPDTQKQQIGPLINDMQVKKVTAIVDDAISKGAQVKLGGKVAKNKGKLYFEPTVLTNIKPDMVCYREEIFGPVAPCIKFSNEEEALRIANDTKTGLAGYFYSNDISQIFRVSKKLQVGMVGINEGAISTPEAAFGGIKESGIGREGSHYGMDEFINIKYLCFGNL